MPSDESLLIDYLLGHVDDKNAEVVRLLSEPDVDQRLIELGNCMDLMTQQLLPVVPTPVLRDNILSSISQTGNGRLEGMRDRLARFFKLGLERSALLLDSIGQLTLPVWEATNRDGVWLQHIQCDGPLADADCGLVHLGPGVKVDAHEHLGDEWMLILSGFVTTDSGRQLAAGDILYSETGSEHAFDVDPDHSCVFAVILHQGLRWTVNSKPDHQGLAH